MKDWFHPFFDSKKLICAGTFALMGFAVHSLSAATPPIAIPYSISTVAGNGSSGATGNGGAATSAELSADIRAVAVDGQGNLYIADTGNNVIRKVNAQTGVITIVAGGATAACTAGIDKSGDGCPAATGTVLKSPRGLAVDKAGNLYIAGYSDSLIHRVDAVTGIMTQVAGALSGVTGTCKTPSTCASGAKGYSGDGTAAVGAAVNQPRGVRVDNFGNIWIADSGNNVIREINAKTGIISTVVGNATNVPVACTSAATCFGGDGSQANSSSVILHVPTDIVFDSQNNAYIVDFDNSRIREVNASTNVIQTIIGNATIATATGIAAAPPVTAPSWPAPAATTTVGNLSKIAIDSYGNLYFTDTGLSLVFFYDAAAQTITPIGGEYFYAGTPSASFPVCSNAINSLGDGCPATQALFYQGGSALGIAIDGLNNIYVSDPSDFRVRKISTNLTFPATATGTTVTQTIELHSSVADALTAGGISVVTNNAGFTVASAPNCTTNSDNTTNCTALVSFDPAFPGLLSEPLVAASANSHSSLPLSGIGELSLLGLDPGTASTLNTAGLSNAAGEAIDAAGNLYIADTGNNRIVKISGSTQTVIAGTGSAIAAQATLNSPSAVAVAPNGFIYIADTGNNLVRVIDPVTGNISTYAGGATTVCAAAYDAQGDFCPAAQATLHSPSGLATDAYSNLYIADTGNNLVRRVDSGTGVINLDAGLATPLSTGTENMLCAAKTDSYGDGCAPTQAMLNAPRGVATDSQGNLYVADTGNNLIRKINLVTGLIANVAGNGQSVFSGDNGTATQASLSAPQAVAVDAAGNIYIADTGNDAIRIVNFASGTITTLLGQGGVPGSSGGNGLISAVELSSPSGIVLDVHGNLYVSDTVNDRVIEDNRNSSEINYGDNNDVGLTSAPQAVTITNLGDQSLIFANTPAYLTSDATDFPISANTCAGGGTLTTGENCALQIEFAPQTNIAYNASVTFPSNAVNQSTVAVALSGTGKILLQTNLKLALTAPASGQISYGQSGTVTATVTPQTGSGTPAGTVTFTVGGTQQPAVALTGGQAQLTLTLPPVGGLTIGATYNSTDGIYANSSNSLNVNVMADTTTTTLSASAGTQTSAQPNIIFKATVSSNTGAEPTGSVNFCTGAVTSCLSSSPTLIGSATVNAQGLASFTYSATSGTGYSVTATYAGNQDFGASSSAATAITVPGDFLPAIIPSSDNAISVPQGGAVQIPTISVTTQGNISGSVTLSCTGLPQNSICTFFPTTLTLGGTAPVQSTSLTIYTNVTPLVLQSMLDKHGPSNETAILLGSALIPSMLFAFSGWTGFRRRNRLNSMMIFAAAALLSSILMLSGCASNATQEKSGVTPTGTSTVQVVLTGPGGVTHSIPITLTVVAGS
ncbi:MAG: Ig-like domain repeat protein [Terracidiphilus sp.]